MSQRYKHETCIWSSTFGFWLLAYLTRDLSQAEKKINVVISRAYAQNDIDFTQSGQSCYFE